METAGDPAAGDGVGWGRGLDLRDRSDQVGEDVSVGRWRLAPGVRTRVIDGKPKRVGGGVGRRYLLGIVSSCER